MKYCTHCGAELLDEAALCPKCGCWTNDNAKLAKVSKPRLSRLSLVGFILSLASIVVSIFFLSLDTDSSAFIFSGIPFAVAGFTCSLIGLIKLKRNQQRGKGYAIAGIVVGAVVGILWLLLIVFAVYIVLLFYVFLLLALVI